MIQMNHFVEWKGSKKMSLRRIGLIFPIQKCLHV